MEHLLTFFRSSVQINLSDQDVSTIQLKDKATRPGGSYQTFPKLKSKRAKDAIRISLVKDSFDKANQVRISSNLSAGHTTTNVTFEHKSAVSLNPFGDDFDEDEDDVTEKFETPGSHISLNTNNDE